MGEVRRTLATCLAVGGITLSPGEGFMGLATFIGTTVALTVVMVVLIVVVSRWGGRA